MAINRAIHSNLAIPPGEYLEEVLDELGMTKDELARRMGRPATKLSPIFKGEKAITPETALQLEQVVGVPAHIWLGLETEYRLTLARQENELCEEDLGEERELVKKFQYSELVKAGMIEKYTKPIDRVRELRKAFGVMSLRNVTESPRYQAAFRYGRSAVGERTPEAVAAWLRMGELLAQRSNCASFNEDKLRGALKDLRTMTLQEPDDFRDQLQIKLAECGVALVVCPHFPKTKAHGATFWMGRDKAVLMLTLRFKWADIFWFSLFHEIGHILLHGRQAVILEDYGDNEKEEQADRFASNTLIPSDAYEHFIQMGEFRENDIEVFAKRVGVDRGIVVGRLQHDGKLEKSWLNNLRSRYVWSETD